MPDSTRADARLIYSASESDANMLWATRFFAPDPFIFIQKRGQTYLVMNDLEIDRARSQARVDKVLSYSEYAKRWQRRGLQFPAAADILQEVFKDLHIKSLEVPSTFPLGLADQLRRLRIRMSAKSDPFWPEREFKTEEEVRFIGDSLRAAEMGPPEPDSEKWLLVSRRHAADVGYSETDYQHDDYGAGIRAESYDCGLRRPVRGPAQSRQRSHSREYIDHHGHFSAVAKNRLFRRYHTNSCSWTRIGPIETCILLC